MASSGSADNSSFVVGGSLDNVKEKGFTPVDQCI